MKRAMDIVIASVLIVATLPLLALTAAAIRVCSPGPVFYRAARAGKGGRSFQMFKFRTMHVSAGGPAISARNDSRIFPLGRMLRLLKIDELPQLLNVLRGDMSVVGPRPEDPRIVETAYSPWMMQTLEVRPGLTGPGTIYYYAHGEERIDPEDPEGFYVESILPAKLAIDRAYMDRATLQSDLAYILRTGLAILGRALGRPVGPMRRDLHAARKWFPAETRTAPLPQHIDGRAASG
jgi:lipopolysaccharide/colanic/teichoic acid biosynthesis glycosyltransferase